MKATSKLQPADNESPVESNADPGQHMNPRWRVMRTATAERTQPEKQQQQRSQTQQVDQFSTWNSQQIPPSGVPRLGATNPRFNDQQQPSQWSLQQWENHQHQQQPSQW